MKLETSPISIALYQHFRDNVYNPKSVFYPSSGFDVSPARVFDRVTFLDSEAQQKGVVKTLRDAGFNAVKCDVREYNPEEEHDLLIIQNPACPAAWVVPHLARGGYVIANNYHGSASEIARMNKSFELIAGVNVRGKSGKEEVQLVRDLDGFFEPVANLAEFKRLRPGDYEFEEGVMRNFAAQGIIGCAPNASEEEKWKAYIAEMWNSKMPAKKSAQDYIFKRK